MKIKEQFVENDYLKKSSYYISLQNGVCKVVSLINPSYVLELGCANGNTSIRIAKENPNCSVVGVDIRQDMQEKIMQQQKLNKVKNLTFVCGDLTKLNNYNIKNVDCVVMLNAFHHIEDPLLNKIDFLSELHSKMRSGTYVVIGEPFLDEKYIGSETIIKKMFSNREKESSYNIFWNNVATLERNDNLILKENSENLAKIVSNEQNDVIKRTGEYYVTKTWLENEASQVGFEVVISEYVNIFNDGVVVLKKK